MKHALLSLALASSLLIAAPLGAAECYADYKAKQDNPLRLHYGVVQIRGDCAADAARTEIAQRLAQAGWTLLNLISVFGPDGLEERKANAGPYFLSF